MERIESRLLRFLRTQEGDFDNLALELFAHQYALNAPYRAYANQLGKTPSTVNRWQQIPAVPVAAFKSVELATFPVSQAAAHFESSGTTQQTKSHHYLKSLNYYEASLLAGFQKAVLPDNAKLPYLLLIPSPGEASRSSLAWMADVIKRRLGEPGSRSFVTRGRVDELFFMTFLRKAQAESQPVGLLGTTIAWLGVLDYLETNNKVFKLPAGSRLMDTGGLKSLKREITRDEFVRRVGERLGIPADRCYNEFGMCELSSQYYGQGASSVLQGPPWIRTLVIDPVTGEEAQAGQPGLLRHFDLANIDSVLAIQTEDKGRRVEIPSALVSDWPAVGFEYLGRDAGAEVRGCSLSADAFAHERSAH